MNTGITNVRCTIRVVFLLGQTVLAISAAAYADSPANSPTIQPIESLWFLSIPRAAPATSDASPRGPPPWTGLTLTLPTAIQRLDIRHGDLGVSLPEQNGE
jgi:hypothetical protein